VTTNGTMPADWVLIEAAKLAGWGQLKPEVLRETYFGSFKALCDALIAPPIKPPVDPDVEAVKRIIAQFYGYKTGEISDNAALTRAVAQYKKEIARD